MISFNNILFKKYLGPVSYQLFLGQNQILKLHQQQRMGIDIFSRVMREQEETIQNENVNKMQLFSKLGPKYVTLKLYSQDCLP